MCLLKVGAKFYYKKRMKLFKTTKVVNLYRLCDLNKSILQKNFVSLW